MKMLLFVFMWIAETSLGLSIIQAQTHQLTGSSLHDCFNRAIEKVRPSVVQIGVEITYNTTPPTSLRTGFMAMGSGFIGDASWMIITARHVVEAIDRLPQDLAKMAGPNPPQIDPASISTKIVVGFATPNLIDQKLRNFAVGSFSQIPATVLTRSTTADVAVLKLARSPFQAAFLNTPVSTINQVELKPIPPAVPIFEGEAPDEGEAIAVSGYPLSVPTMVTTFGWISSKWYIEGLQHYQLGDMQINHGNSGGPVYKIRSGAIIGIAHGFLPALVEGAPGATNSGIAMFVPIQEALDLMKTTPDLHKRL